MNPTVTVSLPAGESCMTDRLKPCIFARYIKHFGTYNCLIYNKALVIKGRNIPIKCAECIEHCKGEGKHEKKPAKAETPHNP